MKKFQKKKVKSMSDAVEHPDEITRREAEEQQKGGRAAEFAYV